MYGHASSALGFDQIFFGSGSGSATTAHAQCLGWAIVQAMSWLRTGDPRRCPPTPSAGSPGGFDIVDLKEAKGLLEELST
jgi:hypothetical protein